MRTTTCSAQRVRSRTSGSVIVTVLVISSLIVLVLIAYLNFVSTQHRLSIRSHNWNGALVMAESGLEEALSHINFSGTSNFAANGWVLTNGVYTKNRTIDNGYFAATISTSIPPVITSQGFVLAPGQANYISRTVQITTTKTSPFKGVIAKDSVSMSGGSYIDSFNSSDPAHSTSGHYDAAKASDNAFVAVNSTASGALKVEAIYGSVASGPGGTVSVTDGVGTRAWVAAHPGTIQSGHFTDDFNLALADVTPPYSGGAFTPGPGMVNGTNYFLVLDGGNYLMSSCTVPGGQAMIVTSNATLYVMGDFTTSGSGYIWLMPGATLDLYVGGKGTISGGGIVNGSELATAMSIYGLPSCTTFTYSGSAQFIGTVYAPSAKFTLSGSANACGAFVAKSFIMSGGMNIHCDEALYSTGSGCKYPIASWREL